MLTSERQKGGLMVYLREPRSSESPAWGFAGFVIVTFIIAVAITSIGIYMQFFDEQFGIVGLTIGRFDRQTRLRPGLSVVIDRKTGVQLIDRRGRGNRWSAINSDFSNQTTRNESSFA